MADQFIKIAVNRKAYHDYTIHETLEAGIVLKGSEIKSIRAGRISLRDAYARIEDDELWLLNCHIASYGSAGYNDHKVDRARKLLVHKEEIRKLSRELQQSRLTIIPLRLYIKHGVAKIELGIAKGKREYDKREAIARRDMDREMGRALKFRRR